jgi:hypothetical protein
VTFADDIVTEQRGDVVEIGVLFEDAEMATARIGSGPDHVTTVVVRDGDGDGSATVQLRTFDGTVTASPGDEATDRTRSSVETPLAPETYDLDLWSGNGTDGERTDVAALAVDERSTGDFRTWVASGSADLSNRTGVLGAKASGNLTRSDTLVKNDTLVLELRASGLEGALAAQNGSNATTAFLGLLDGEEAELRVLQTNPTPERRPAELHLAEYDSTRVVTDQANDSYYLVADLQAANVTRGTVLAEIRAGQEYDVNFSLPGASALSTNGTESARTAFAVVDPAVEFSTAGENREFAVPAPNRTVSGRTTLPPGTRLTVKLRSPDGDHAFSKTVRVRNGSDGHGRFAVDFDFSGVPDGTNLTVDVRADAYPALDFDPTHVIVAEPTGNVEFGTADANGASLSATLSHGGFVAVHRGSADGELLGRSQYLSPDDDETTYVNFDPDLESNGTVVAVAYRDGDRDGEFDPGADEPYTDGDRDRRAATSESVTVGDSDETTDRRTTRETARTTTRSPVQEETTAEPVTEPESPAEPGVPGIGSPGFGVGSVLLALLVCALFGRRRTS